MSSAVSKTNAYPSWLIPLLSMLAAGLLAFLLYSRALDFAFFNDDPTGHFAWMETRSYGDYFRTSADYGYYRPIVFAVLQGLIDVFAYNARAFHALLLLLNAANVALLWLLAWRLAKSAAFAWATALIFAFCPFNYEAVTYVASLTHPLLLFWLLLALLTYQQARRAASRNRRLILYAVAMLAMLLGLLTHENGLIIPLAIVGVEWIERPPKGLVEAFKRPFWPYLLLTPIFLVVWWSIPKTSEQILPTLSNWAGNLVPFAQTLVYPLLPLFDLTGEQTTLLWGLVALTLGGTFVSAWLAKAVDLWLFGLGWFLVSILPATLFLSPDYLYGSPRLHYLPAVGVAILWALPVLALARLLPQNTWVRLTAAAAGVLYLLAILLPPVGFINCELDFYAETSRIVRRMSALSHNTGDGRDLLFVNVPIFFSSYSAYPNGCENPYPWTPTGAVLMPAYADARDFVRFNGGTDRVTTAVRVDDYAPGWNAFGTAVSASDLRQRVSESEVYAYDLNAGDFFNLSHAWRFSEPEPDQPLAAFGDILQLDAVDVDTSAGDESLKVTLTWQVLSPAAEGSTPSVFVHIYDSGGGLIAQHDGPPASSFVPSAWWHTGDLLVDEHAIDLENALPPGDYTLGVGLYNPLNGERLAATSRNQPLPDDLYIAGKLNRS